jgi:hypothetical protein
MKKKELGDAWYNPLKLAYTDDITYGTGDNEHTKPICEKLTEIQIKIYTMDNFLKNLIIVLNVVIRMVVIMIVNYIGCNTESG